MRWNCEVGQTAAKRHIKMETDFLSTQAVNDDLDNTYINEENSGDDEDNEEVGTLKVLPNKKTGIPTIEFPIYSGENVVGRHTSCNISIPWSIALSKKHAIIESDAGSCFVSDCGSSNKTRLGKATLKPNVKYGLRCGDEVVFADVHCIFRQHNASSNGAAELFTSSNNSISNTTPRLERKVLANDTPEMSVTATVQTTLDTSTSVAAGITSPPLFQLDETTSDVEDASLQDVGNTVGSLTGKKMTTADAPCINDTGSDPDVDYHMDSDTDIEENVNTALRETKNVFEVDTIELVSGASSQPIAAEAVKVETSMAYSDTDEDDHELSMIAHLDCEQTQRFGASAPGGSHSLQVMPDSVNEDPVDASRMDDEPILFVDLNSLAPENLAETKALSRKKQENAAEEKAGCSGIGNQNPDVEDIETYAEPDSFGDLSTQEFFSSERLNNAEMEDTLGILETQVFIRNPIREAEDTEEPDSMLFDMATQAIPGCLRVSADEQKENAKRHDLSDVRKSTSSQLEEAATGNTAGDGKTHLFKEGGIPLSTASKYPTPSVEDNSGFSQVLPHVDLMGETSAEEDTEMFEASPVLHNRHDLDEMEESIAPLLVRSREAAVDVSETLFGSDENIEATTYDVPTGPLPPKELKDPPIDNNPLSDDDATQVYSAEMDLAEENAKTQNLHVSVESKEPIPGSASPGVDGLEPAENERLNIQATEENNAILKNEVVENGDTAVMPKDHGDEGEVVESGDDGVMPKDHEDEGENGVAAVMPKGHGDEGEAPESSNTIPASHRLYSAPMDANDGKVTGCPGSDDMIKAGCHPETSSAESNASKEVVCRPGASSTISTDNVEGAYQAEPSSTGFDNHRNAGYQPENILQDSHVLVAEEEHQGFSAIGTHPDSRAESEDAPKNEKLHSSTSLKIDDEEMNVRPSHEDYFPRENDQNTARAEKTKSEINSENGEIRADEKIRPANELNMPPTDCSENPEHFSTSSSGAGFVLGDDTVAHDDIQPTQVYANTAPLDSQKEDGRMLEATQAYLVEALVEEKHQSPHQWKDEVNYDPVLETQTYVKIHPKKLGEKVSVADAIDKQISSSSSCLMRDKYVQGQEETQAYALRKEEKIFIPSLNVESFLIQHNQETEKALTVADSLSSEKVSVMPDLGTSGSLLWKREAKPPNMDVGDKEVHHLEGLTMLHVRSLRRSTRKNYATIANGTSSKDAGAEDAVKAGEKKQKNTHQGVPCSSGKEDLLGASQQKMVARRSKRVSKVPESATIGEENKNSLLLPKVRGKQQSLPRGLGVGRLEVNSCVEEQRNEIKKSFKEDPHSLKVQDKEEPRPRRSRPRKLKQTSRLEELTTIADLKFSDSQDVSKHGDSQDNTKIMSTRTSAKRKAVKKDGNETTAKLRGRKKASQDVGAASSSSPASGSTGSSKTRTGATKNGSEAETASKKYSLRDAKSNLSVNESKSKRVSKKTRSGSTLHTEQESVQSASDDMSTTSGVKRTRKRGNAASRPTKDAPSSAKKMKSDESSVNSELSSCCRDLRPKREKPRIMFTGILDSVAEGIVTNLGGKLVSDITECTHLVSDEIRRTIKFLCALARGLQIVTPQWLHSSAQRCRFLPEEDFQLSSELHSRNAESLQQKYNFRFERSLQLARENPAGLLHGFSIFVTKNVVPTPQQMHQILQSAGARMLTRMPGAASSAVDNVVIATANDRRACAGAIKAGCKIVTNEFVLTGILRHQVDFAPYALFDSCAVKE